MRWNKALQAKTIHPGFLRTAIALLMFLFGYTGLFSQRPYNDTTFTLFFDSGKFRLDSQSMNIIRKSFVDNIINDRKYFYQIRISGYADKTGSDSANYKLSMKRALSVANYIKSLGGDSAIVKTGSYDYMSGCEGVKVATMQYTVPVFCDFFGEKFSKNPDSLKAVNERKVLLSYADYRNACLGVFRVCSLPPRDMIFRKDSIITLSIARGYLDEYTYRENAHGCKYDSLTTRLDIRIVDSISDKNQLCSDLLAAYHSRKKESEIRIGSLSFIKLLNDTLMPEPECKFPPKTPPTQISIARRLIPVNDFSLYTRDRQALNYIIKDNFIVIDVSLAHLPDIEIYTKNKLFKRAKLIIRGSVDYAVSTTEPADQCAVPFDMQDSKKGLFVKKASYDILKFTKAETVLQLYNERLQQTKTINLKDIKYNKKKKAYILKRKALKALK
jgi:hypothetical protein